MARHHIHARCSGTDAQGVRCRSLVPLANALHFVRGGRLPYYCAIHEKEILAEKTMGTTRFGAFVPPSLEPRTQTVLHHLMRKPKAKSDRWGYIYALRLIDRAHPDRVRIKLGRSNDIMCRFSEHQRWCPSSRPILLGRTSRVPNCDRLERLIHIELADRTARSIPTERNAPCTKCKDCNTIHKEIFTFKRLRGRDCGREWPIILRPIVEKWAQFVAKIV